MKYLIFLFICLSPLVIQGQIFEKTYDIFENYNPDTLSKYLDSAIDLTIEDEYEYLNKKKALSRLNDFIQTHGTIKIVRRHKGSAKNQNSNYRVAHMNTILGDYRLYIYSERSGKKHLIKEVRLEKA